MATITINVPDELLESFDSLEQVQKTVYEDFVIEQRQQGNISLGRAAELLGITYTEFFDLLQKRPFFYKYDSTRAQRKLSKF